MKTKQVTRILLIIILLLMGIDICLLISRWGFGHGNLMGLGPLFDLDDEINIPNFYSSTTLLFSGLLLFLLAIGQRRSSGRFIFHWYGLAALFTYFSLDEMLSLHERLIEPVRAALGTSGVLYYAWIIPYGAAVILLGFIYLPFVMGLPPTTRRDFIVAGIVYLAGTIGMEMVGSLLASKGVGRTLTMDICAFVEESLEMFGILLFIRALLNELGNRQARILFNERVEAAD